MRIRSATLSDGRMLSSLATYAWISTYGKQGMSDTMASYVASEFSPARYRTRLMEKGRMIWVVQLKKRLVGFCEVVLKTKHNATPATTQLDICYLHDPSQAGDLRTELFHHALQELQKYTIRDLWLSVWNKDLETLQWCQKLGFKEVDEFFLEIDGEHLKHAVMDNCSDNG